MVVFPGSKINLGLNILRRRADGYHDIATCMIPVGWSDVLEAVASQNGHTELHQSGYALDCPPADNLIMKAYRMLAEDYDVKPLDIYIHKCVPSGAGLGGGSADAAWTLRVISDLCDLKLDDEKLASYAGRLGSDCPFFIFNRPMICEGTGTNMTPTVIPSAAGLWVAVVKPPIHISTAAAYAGVTPGEPEVELRDALAMPTSLWKEVLRNDFETSLAKDFPEIAGIKRHFYERGATYCSLSGSGSAVYALFADKDSATQALSSLPYTDRYLGQLPLNPSLL